MTHLRELSPIQHSAVRDLLARGLVRWCPSTPSGTDVELSAAGHALLLSSAGAEPSEQITLRLSPCQVAHLMTLAAGRGCSASEVVASFLDFLDEGR